MLADFGILLADFEILLAENKKSTSRSTEINLVLKKYSFNMCPKCVFYGISLILNDPWTLIVSEKKFTYIVGSSHIHFVSSYSGRGKKKYNFRPGHLLSPLIIGLYSIINIIKKLKVSILCRKWAQKNIRKCFFHVNGSKMIRAIFTI